MPGVVGLDLDGAVVGGVGVRGEERDLVQVVDESGQVSGLLAAGRHDEIGPGGGPGRAVVAVQAREQGRGGPAAGSVDRVLDEARVGDGLALRGRPGRGRPRSGARSRPPRGRPRGRARRPRTQRGRPPAGAGRARRGPGRRRPPSRATPGAPRRARWSRRRPRARRRRRSAATATAEATRSGSAITRAPSPAQPRSRSPASSHVSARARTASYVAAIPATPPRTSMMSAPVIGAPAGRRSASRGCRAGAARTGPGARRAGRRRRR